MINPHDGAQTDPNNAPIEPTFDQEAECLLERAAQHIRWLTERNALLQMKSDTVDQLCSLGKSPPQYGNSVSGMNAEPSFLYRIEALLRVRKEARQHDTVAAIRAKLVAEIKAAAANASPDPRTTPLGF